VIGDDGMMTKRNTKQTKNNETNENPLAAFFSFDDHSSLWHLGAKVMSSLPHLAGMIH
jgi:hypothetical protein